jgi:hypothetical protein
MASGDLVSRVYSNFRGADFRGDEVNLMRSPDCKNVWRNYKSTTGIETRPGAKEKIARYEFLNTLYNSVGGDGYDTTIYGIYFYNNAMIIHSGEFLFKKDSDGLTVLFEGAVPGKSDAFIFNNLWYFKDGKNYLQYDGTDVKGISEVAYIPTTTIGRKPEGGGTLYEDVNLLSPWRINTFIGDGKSTEFYVDAQNLETAGSDGGPDSIESIEPSYVIEINGENAKTIWKTDENGDYITDEDGNYIFKYSITWNREKGKFTIKPAPPAPLTEGQDNVSIKFKKSTDGKKIRDCTLLQVFDNRVFFSGNPNYPNMMWHSSLNDPTYCSDLDYYNEGLDDAEVKGMVAGNNALWVFKEPSQANTTIFYHTPTTDSEYGKIYPNSHSSISTGCIGKAINFNDDIVFFSERGMEGISGDITSEQVVAHRSSLVDRKLIEEWQYRNMVLVEWEGYMLAFVGDRVYLADSRAMFTNENHMEYEWFYWELDELKLVTCARVNDGILYIGTEDGVYTLNDVMLPVKSCWTTPKDKFNHPQYLKTTNKRGCVVEAKTLREDATITVDARAVKEDTLMYKDIGFEKIGTYANVDDYFVCRIKRKKWKDIQLKFSSDTRFSLDSVTLQAFIGGYIKR